MMTFDEHAKVAFAKRDPWAHLDRLLLTLWQDGFSRFQIGCVLDKSPSAVIGRVWRLRRAGVLCPKGLPLRSSHANRKTRLLGTFSAPFDLATTLEKYGPIPDPYEHNFVPVRKKYGKRVTEGTKTDNLRKLVASGVSVRNAARQLGIKYGRANSIMLDAIVSPDAGMRKQAASYTLREDAIDDRLQKSLGL